MKTSNLDISETHIWSYRDSFYQFTLTPKNYVPGLILGVLFAVGMIYFTGLRSNPLLAFVGYVALVMALFVLGSLIWEFLKFQKMDIPGKTLHWTIDDKTLKCLDGAGESRVIRWNRVKRTKRTLAGYMLHRSTGAPVWISIDLFSPDQAEQFEAFLDERSS